MELVKFNLAQIEIDEALHRFQEIPEDFADLVADISRTAAWLPDGRVKRYLENWIASVGESEQLRYDKLAAYWAGLWAACEK